MSNDNVKSVGFVTLQEIVYEVLNDENNYSLENFKRYLQFVIRGYTQLKLYDLQSLDVAYLTMSDSGTVDLPSDFINYTKIGIRDSRGNIYILGLNDDMSLAREMDCGVDVGTYFNSSDDESINDLCLDGYYFAPHYCGSSYCTALYGQGGGYAESYYRVDLERGQIQFSSSVPSGEIVLEYISSGISMTGSTHIPKEAKESLIAFCHWKRKQHDPVFTRGERQDAKADFLEEENLLRDFQMPTMVEIQDLFYESYKQTPKR